MNITFVISDFLSTLIPKIPKKYVPKIYFISLMINILDGQEIVGTGRPKNHCFTSSHVFFMLFCYLFFWMKPRAEKFEFFHFSVNCHI